MKLNDAIYEVMTAEEVYNTAHDDNLYQIMTREIHDKIVAFKNAYIEELAAYKYNLDRRMIQDHVAQELDKIYGF